MRRMPILCRNRFLWRTEDVFCPRYAVLVGISPGYPSAQGRLHTCYSPVRRSPAGEASFAPAAPRLACVKPVASVHPEPGSNSPLLLILFFFFSKGSQGKCFCFVCLSQDGVATVVFVSRPQVDCLSLSWWKLTEPNFTAVPPVVCSGRFRAVPFSLVLLSYLMSNFQCPRASGGAPRSARQSYGEIPNCQNCFAILTFFIVSPAPPGCLSGVASRKRVQR